MTVANLKSFGAPIIALAAQEAGGTDYVFVVLSSGKLIRYQIGAGTLVLKNRIAMHVKDIITDNTYLYILTRDKLLRYTIADQTLTTLTKFGSPAKCMSFHNAIVYVGLMNGKLWSWTA